MRWRKPEEVVDGIGISPVPITLGEEVKIRYKGKLAENAGSPIYMHLGFGRQRWEEVKEVPMRRERDGGWTATVNADRGPFLNFCFHNEEGSWDNNTGRDWSLLVHDGS